MKTKFRSRRVFSGKGHEVINLNQVDEVSKLNNITE